MNGVKTWSRFQIGPKNKPLNHQNESWRVPQISSQLISKKGLRHWFETLMSGNQMAYRNAMNMRLGSTSPDFLCTVLYMCPIYCKSWETSKSSKLLGLSENRVYSQWNSYLIGIMIINHWVWGYTTFSDTPYWSCWENQQFGVPQLWKNQQFKLIIRRCWCTMLINPDLSFGVRLDEVLQSSEVRIMFDAKLGKGW